MKRPVKYNTDNKRIVYDIVSNIGKDFNAKDIYNIVISKKANVGVSTIYRILDELLNEHFLVKLVSEDNTIFYRYIEKCDNHKHLLLKCNVCSEITHVDCEIVENFSNHLASKHNFDVEVNQSFIPGICKNCKKEGERNEKNFN